MLLVLTCQIFLIISGATTLRSIHFGLGRYLDEVPIWYQDDLLRYLFLNEILYAFLILLIRLTIGLLLLKIITHHRKERAFVIFILVISSLNAIQFVIWAFLQCQPLPHFWNRLSPGICHERAFTIVLYVSSLINILTEWALAFLPVYMAIRMLIMSLKDRIAIAVVLGMGALASVATCVRMVYLGILLEGKADVRCMYRPPSLTIIADPLRYVRHHLHVGHHRELSRHHSGMPCNLPTPPCQSSRYDGPKSIHRRLLRQNAPQAFGDHARHDCQQERQLVHITRRALKCSGTRLFGQDIGRARQGRFGRWSIAGVYGWRGEDGHREDDAYSHGDQRRLGEKGRSMRTSPYI